MKKTLSCLFCILLAVLYRLYHILCCDGFCFHGLLLVTGQGFYANEAWKHLIFDSSIILPPAFLTGLLLTRVKAFSGPDHRASWNDDFRDCGFFGTPCLFCLSWWGSADLYPSRGVDWPDNAPGMLYRIQAFP